MKQPSYILTLPSFNNYGGVLQGYALQQVLQKHGVENNQIGYLPRGLEEWYKRQGKREKLRALKTLLKMIFYPQAQRLPDYMIAAFFMQFRKKHMNLFRLNSQRTQLSKLSSAYRFIVGSDQVWRCEYSRESEHAPFFFLSFTDKEQRQRSIAYAASFGSDEWEGTPEETVECARLINEFKAVSVREHSGIRICREVFGVNAVQMPDPTLLLEQQDYQKLISSNIYRRRPKKGFATYLLDSSSCLNKLASDAAQQLRINHYSLTDNPQATNWSFRFPLTIPQWLRGIQECEYMLTDSFHGCVFAIIFNKPFVCLGNASRGSARFDSLLGTFGLQNRLLINPTAKEIAECLNTPIDWERVNGIRSSEKQRALQFLKENLA